MKNESQEEIDEIAEQIELAADIQTAEARNDEEMHRQSLTDEEKEEMAIQEMDENEHILILTKSYHFGGKTIDRIDLSGLDNLTTKDLEYADRVIARMNHAPEDKFTDVLWNRMIAVRTTGLSREFFAELRSRDMLAVVGTIRQFFLIGWE